MNIRNILCDRDGTIIVDKHYLSNPTDVELLPTVQEGILLLQQHGYFIGIISNQSGVGRGYFTTDDVDACNSAMSSLITPQGNCFTSIMYCPHSPEEQCICRKPALGMWHEIQQLHQLEAQHTVMIGDKKEDILFAINAQFPLAFLVYTGKGKETLHTLGITCTSTCYDITEAFTQHYVNNTHKTTIYAVERYIDAIDYILAL